MSRLGSFSQRVFSKARTISEFLLNYGSFTIGDWWILVLWLGVIAAVWVGALLLVGVFALALIPVELAVGAGVGGAAATVATVKIVSTIRAKGKCLVCRQKLLDQPDNRRCATCLTTYHAACWQYMGRCSRYGCRR